LISTRGAAIFAILAGITGVTALYYGVNPTTACLGALNIGLYAAVYTPLKRISVVNTWVGALVGALPPLMGWTAAAGQSATEGGWRELLLGEQNYGGWLLAAFLGVWQFPHFMSLSWSIREEYRAAGYRMLCWVNPGRNGRVALRYSLAMFPVCILLCYTGVTEWSFAVASAPVNIWLVREAWKFWRYEGFKGSARGLFWASVWHLPVVLVLAMVEKRGMWQRVWRAVMGEGNPDDEEEWIDEDEEDAVLSAKHLSPEAKKAAISMPTR
jgi:protoheme IX farnesyltransferase